MMPSTGTTPTTLLDIPTVPLIKIHKGTITKVMGNGLTGLNWVTWQVWMSLLALCEVEPYICSKVQQPNQEEDLVSHNNWKKNNNYAKHLITQNMDDEATTHIQHGSSYNIAWKNLEAIFEDRSQETVVAISGIILLKKGMTLVNTSLPSRNTWSNLTW